MSSILARLPHCLRDNVLQFAAQHRNRISLICSDIRDFQRYPCIQCFDIVFINENVPNFKRVFIVGGFLCKNCSAGIRCNICATFQDTFNTLFDTTKTLVCEKCEHVVIGLVVSAIFLLVIALVRIQMMLNITYQNIFAI